MTNVVTFYGGGTEKAHSQGRFPRAVAGKVFLAGVGKVVLSAYEGVLQ